MIKNRRILKCTIPFLCISVWILACNRPMLQPPAPIPSTKSGVINTQTPVPVLLKATPASTSPSTQPISPEIALNDTSILSSTNPTPYPYFTPAWCPVKPTTFPEIGKLRVVYASPGGLWVKDEGRSGIPLSHNSDIGQVSISEDGQIIAYTRQLDEYQAELWVINSDGSHQRRLLSPGQFKKLDGSQDALGVLPSLLRWEPGSHHIIFYTYPIYHAIWVFEPSTIWLIDADTGEISQAPYHGGYVSFAPDGKQVAIYNTSGINLVNVDGSKLKENILPDYHGIAEGESYYDPRPFWSHDSSSLLVAIPDQNDMYMKDASITVWKAPVNGAPIKMGQWKAFAPSVSVSPDQSYITYWPSPQGIANQRELHLVRLGNQINSSSSDNLYVHGELIDVLAWSPDSQHFIFQMGDPGSQNMFFYLGGICQQPKRLDGFISGGTLPWNIGSNIADWVDSNHYLLVAGLPKITDQWELYLSRINQGQSEKIGVITAYDWTILP